MLGSSKVRSMLGTVSSRFNGQGTGVVKAYDFRVSLEDTGKAVRHFECLDLLHPSESRFPVFSPYIIPLLKSIQKQSVNAGKASASGILAPNARKRFRLTTCAWQLSSRLI